MAESQNPALLAALRRHYSGLWQKNPQYKLIVTIVASPKTVMAPLFDNTALLQEFLTALYIAGLILH